MQVTSSYNVSADMYNASRKPVAPLTVGLAATVLGSRNTLLASAHTVALAILFLASTVGNATVVGILWRKPRMRTVTNTFVGSLSSAQLLLTITCLPFSMLTLFTGTWSLGWVLCVLNRFLHKVFGVASTLSLTLVAVDRLFWVSRSNHCKISERACRVSITLIWIHSLIFALPWCDFKPGVETEVLSVLHCMDLYHSWKLPDANAYGCDSPQKYLVVTLTLLMPCCVQLYCAVRLGLQIRYNARRVSPATVRAHYITFSAEVRTAVTVCIMVVLFCFCWLPFGVLTLAGGLIPFEGLRHVVDSCLFLAYANAAINPIIYAVRNPTVREVFRTGPIHGDPNMWATARALNSRKEKERNENALAISPETIRLENLPRGSVSIFTVEKLENRENSTSPRLTRLVAKKTPEDSYKPTNGVNESPGVNERPPS